jgi:hypothetical protein
MSNGVAAVQLLNAILEKQHEQTALLRLLVQKQQEHSQSISNWKVEHPELSKKCSAAAKKANDLINQMIERLVEELEDFEGWEGGFSLNELIDKYGHRIQQLSGIAHTLTQLGSQ